MDQTSSLQYQKDLSVHIYLISQHSSLVHPLRLLSILIVRYIQTWLQLNKGSVDYQTRCVSVRWFLAGKLSYIIVHRRVILLIVEYCPTYRVRPPRNHRLASIRPQTGVHLGKYLAIRYQFPVAY